MNRKMVAGIAAVVLMAAAVCWAVTPGGEPADAAAPVGIKAKIAKAFKDANLTVEQKQQIAGILKSHRDEVHGMIESYISARKDMHAQIVAQPVNEEAIRTACKKVAGAGEDLAVKVAQIHAELRKVLTPEQAAQFDALKLDVSAQAEAMMRKGLGRLNNWIESNTIEKAAQ